MHSLQNRNYFKVSTIFYLKPLYFNTSNSFFKVSYVSFPQEAYPTGIKLYLFPIWSSTAFRLTFDVSIKNFHSSGLWHWSEDAIRLVIQLQKHISPSLFIKPYEIFMSLSVYQNKYIISHTWSFDPRNSALILLQPKSCTTITLLVLSYKASNISVEECNPFLLYFHDYKKIVCILYQLKNCSLQTTSHCAILAS